MCRKLFMIMKPELLFHNGTVFDGRRFLPAGTGVRVRAGRITGVGPAGSLGPLGSAEPVDLAGGTLLPGFIDAHAHPVFAGHQLRRCDLGDASTEPATWRSSLATPASIRTRNGSPVAAGNCPPSPAASRPGSRSTPWCRTGLCTCRTATATGRG